MSPFKKKLTKLDFRVVEEGNKLAATAVLDAVVNCQASHQ